MLGVESVASGAFAPRLNMSWDVLTSGSPPQVYWSRIAFRGRINEVFRYFVLFRMSSYLIDVILFLVVIQVNSALATLTYHPALNWNSDGSLELDVIKLVVDDSFLFDEQSIFVKVRAVNDAPLIVVPRMGR